MIRKTRDFYVSAFAGLPRVVWTLAIASLIQRAGSMVLPFLTLWLTRERGLDAAEAGFGLGLYGAGALVGTWLGGWYSDRLAPGTVMIGSFLGTAAVFVALLFLDDVLSVLVALTVLGAIAESFRPANGVMLTRAVEPEHLQRAFGLVRLAVNLGFSVGPLVGGFLAAVDYDWLFIVNATACVAAALWLVWALPRLAVPAGGQQEQEADSEAPAPEETGCSPWRDGTYLWVLAFTFLSGAIFFQVFTIYPLYYGEHLGWSEALIGTLFAANTVIICLFEMVLIAGLTGWNPLRASALGTLLLGCGLGLLPLSGGIAWAFLVVAVWTVGEMIIGPMLAAYTGQRAPRARQGAYFGAFNLSFAAAHVVAPAAGGWAFAEISPDAPWWLCAGLGVLSAAGFAVLSRAPVRSVTKG